MLLRLVLVLLAGPRWTVSAVVVPQSRLDKLEARVYTNNSQRLVSKDQSLAKRTGVLMDVELPSLDSDQWWEHSNRWRMRVRSSIIARLHSEQDDWTMRLDSYGFFFPLVACLLALALHKPSLAALKKSTDVAGQEDITVETTSMAPALVVLSVAMLSSGSFTHSSAAQVPLVFMVLGFGLGRQGSSRSLTLRLFLALLASYSLSVGFSFVLDGMAPLDATWALVQTFVPVETLSSLPLSGTAQATSLFGAAIACLAFSNVLARICGGADLSGLAYLWFVALMSLHLEHTNNSYYDAMASIPVRLQLHSFAAGLIVSSWAPPGKTTRAIGFVVMICYAWLCKIALPPAILHSVYRGLFLPVQTFILWCTIDLLTLHLPSVTIFEANGTRSRQVATLGVSFVTLMLPALAVHGFAAVFLVSIVGHLLEHTIWTAFEYFHRKQAPLVDANFNEAQNFLGELTGEDRPSVGKLSSCVHVLAYYGFFLVGVLTIFSSDTSRPVPGGQESTCFGQNVHFQHVIKGFVWCIVCLGTIPMLGTNIGQLLFPAVLRREVPAGSELAPHPQSDIVISFRYCTRGNNPVLIHENCRRAHRVLLASGLPREQLKLEVVTDNALKLSELCKEGVLVTETLVPSNYICPQGAKYKARALHYAALHSDVNLKPTDWIVHLDEETYFDAHTVCAVYQHCQEQNALVKSGAKVFPDMGQGAILYNTFGLEPENVLTALADTGRVSDDFGKFRLCYSVFRYPAIGMHGSFAVINQAVEEIIGFDVGELGSITEDSYFALDAHSKHNLRMAWIGAFMYEQSPFTAIDLMRQRGRWFHGLFHCCWFGNNKFPLRSNWGLTLLMMVWASGFAIFPLRYIVPYLCHPDPTLLWFVEVYSTIGMINYALGYIVNFSPYVEGWGRWLVLFYMQVGVFLIIITMMELGGVALGVYLLLKAEAVFHVVQKEKPAEPTKPKVVTSDDVSDQFVVVSDHILPKSLP